jgi:TusA-related sulfurtransferase
MTGKNDRDQTAIEGTGSSASRVTPTSPDTPTSTAIFEANGLTCGVLEPAIAAHLRRLSSGDVLEIRSDRTEADGISAWVSLAGHTLIAVEHDPQQDRGRYFVRKKPAPA